MAGPPIATGIVLIHPSAFLFWLELANRARVEHSARRDCETFNALALLAHLDDARGLEFRGGLELEDLELVHGVSVWEFLGFVKRVLDDRVNIREPIFTLSTVVIRSEEKLQKQIKIM